MVHGPPWIRLVSHPAICARTPSILPLFDVRFLGDYREMRPKRTRSGKSALRAESAQDSSQSKLLGGGGLRPKKTVEPGCIGSEVLVCIFLKPESIPSPALDSGRKGRKKEHKTNV